MFSQSTFGPLVAFSGSFLFSLTLAHAAPNTLPPELKESLVSRAGLSVDERALLWIKDLERVPYELAPLGEGEGARFDGRPYFRLDRFDCHTWVDTIAAFSLSHSEREFWKLFQRLRYEGNRIDFFTRRHFLEISNQFPDLTEKLYSKHTKKLLARIDLMGWASTLGPARIYPSEVQSANAESKVDRSRDTLESRLKELRAEGAKRFTENPIREAKIVFVPFKEVAKLDFKRLPKVAVVDFVREDWRPKQEAGTQMWIAHRGLLVTENGRARMIHSSKDAKGVISVMFEDYVKRRIKNWSPGGVRFLALSKDELE